MNTDKILKYVKEFERFAVSRVWEKGKDYILQKDPAPLFWDLANQAINEMDEYLSKQ